MQHRSERAIYRALCRCGLLAAGLLAITPAVGQTAAPAAADPIVAQRGGQKLTAGDVRAMIANADPDLRHQLQTSPAALDTLVRDRLLQLGVLAEAHDRHWDSRPEVVWRADQAHDAALAQGYVASLTQPDPSYPSEAEIQAAYDANKGRLVMPRQYHLAQIYLAVQPGAPATADAAAQKKLAGLRAQAGRSQADFAALARKLSDDHASAPNGGDLGWAREDALLPGVRGAVAGLTEGSVSEPIHSGDGWHLVRLLGTRPAAPATLAEVHDALVRALRQRRAQQNAQAYVDGLLRREPIQINQIQLSALAKE